MGECDANISGEEENKMSDVEWPPLREKWSCAACRFYAPYPHLSESSKMLGECRHELPSMQGTRERARWPRTWPEDWCGEWLPVGPDTRIA